MHLNVLCSSKPMAQNQWLRDNVVDNFGNYIYCVSCLTAYLGIGDHRLHQQRIIKQHLMTEPVVQMSKGDVVCHRFRTVRLASNR